MCQIPLTHTVFISPSSGRSNEPLFSCLLGHTVSLKWFEELFCIFHAIISQKVVDSRLAFEGISCGICAGICWNNSVLIQLDI